MKAGMIYRKKRKRLQREGEGEGGKGERHRNHTGGVTHSTFSGRSVRVMHTQLTRIVTVINMENHLGGSC